MIRTIKYFKNNRNLYLAIGFTLVFFLYLTYILVPFSSCFKLDAGSNSLGISFSYTKEMVQNFFESRTQGQLLCYSEFLQIWDVLFAIVYTLMYTSWIVYFFNNKRLFLIIPILCMIADWAENYVESFMLENQQHYDQQKTTFIFRKHLSKPLWKLWQSVTCFDFGWPNPFSCHYWYVGF